MEGSVSNNSWFVRAVPLPEGRPVYVRSAIRMAPASETEDKSSWADRELRLHWVLGNMLGVVAGAAISGLLSYLVWDWTLAVVWSLGPRSDPLVSLSQQDDFWFWLAWIPYTIIVGIAQFLAIRKHIPGMSKWWLLLSMSSAVVSGALLSRVTRLDLQLDWLPVPDSDRIVSAICGAVAGGLIGAGQWVILRLYSTRARNWVIVYALVGAVAVLLAGSTEPLAHLDLTIECWGPPCRTAVLVPGWQLTAVIGFIAPIVTGFTLVNLLRHPASRAKRQA
jgi:hypothetical protein